MRLSLVHGWKWTVTAAAVTATACQAFCTPPLPLVTVSDVVVSFPGADTAHPPLLLFSGMAGGSCRSYEMHVGSPDVTLVAVTNDPTCPTEINVFAPDRAAKALAVDPADPSSDDWLVLAIASGSLSIAMDGPSVVPLALWLVGSGGGVTQAKMMRDRMLHHAFPMLGSLATGFTLDTVSETLAPTALTPDCNSASAIAANPSIYDASRINVYLVEDYGNINDLTPAMNCAHRSHREIVFISWSNPNVQNPTLVHELGHALGLVHPQSLWGHTYGITGFDGFNLMAQGATVLNATVGQLYALNFSSDSWINRPGAPQMKPVVKSCQDSWGPGTCPALTLTQAGWP